MPDSNDLQYVSQLDYSLQEMIMEFPSHITSKNVQLTPLLQLTYLTPNQFISLHTQNEIYSDPVSPYHISPQSEYDFYQQKEQLSHNENNQNAFYYGIYSQPETENEYGIPDRQFIGQISITDINWKEKRCSLHIGLCTKYTNLELLLEIVEMILSMVFQTSQISTIEFPVLETETEYNKLVKNVIAQFNGKKDGRRRNMFDESIDLLYYSITKSELF